MPGETIKERIDQNKNNFIDTNEIENFIFDQNEGEKNLNDLGTYLNNLPMFNNDEIKTAIQNDFFRSKTWRETENNIIQKINANKPLNKKELSLLYLNMISDNFIIGSNIGQLSKDQIKFEADKPIDQICNGKLIQFIRQKYITFIYTGENTGEEREGLQKGGDKVSEDMFEQLLTMENSQNFVAKIHRSNFGETFVTGPYGMVYKHIDAKGNLLEKPTKFKAGERSDPRWAKQNAKAYYDKRAQERKDLLDGKGCEYNQTQLDSLVSASGGTKKSVERLQNFVLSHREQPTEVSNFMSTFATKSQNGQVQPGLVIRRQFESNWFNGIQKPIEEYQREYYKQKDTQKRNTRPQQRSRRRRR